LNIQCKLKQCVHCEKNECTIFIPPIIKILKPNSIKCPMFDDNPQKSFEEIKKRKYHIEVELKDVKKSKRKTRSDKGKKRGPRKKD